MKIIDDDRAGQQLGMYRLVRLLGRGMHSEVYLGEHLHLAVPVAIKILSGSLVKNEVKKFLLHASTLAQLKHASIVHVVDFGLEGSSPFLVMEYAPHGNLRQRHPKGARVPLETVVSYVRQIANALDYVHKHRLIHRDIKPSNMLLRADNSVMLSDFGIAVASSSLDALHAEEFEGTVAYAAPEQLQGRPRRNSDQYALGVVVYEWLTGAWPFRGTFAEVAQQHLLAPPPGLREKNAAIALDVEKVVLKALAKDPGKRFTTVQQFAGALERLVPAQEQAPACAELHTAPTPKRQFLSPFPFEPVPVGETTLASESAMDMLTRLANGSLRGCM